MPDWVSASSLAPSRDAAPPGPPATGDKAGQPDDVPEDPRQFTLSEFRLLQALAKRRKVLDARSRELAQRQALLKAAEQQLVKCQVELLKIEQNPEQILKVADKKKHL